MGSMADDYDGNEPHPPPYGHYRGPDVYLDHIYETIDQDEPPAPSFNVHGRGLDEECHSRSRSDASSHQSSSSLGCDRRPLIRHTFNHHQRTDPAMDLASADPALVMAVFEGDRVKCRLQPVDGRPTIPTAKHPCQPSAHLSTDC